MNFALTKEQETLKKGLAILLEERGHVYGEGGISITPVLTEENKLKIEKKGLDVTISCKEKAHFFPWSRLSLPASGGCGFCERGDGLYRLPGRYAGLLQKRCSHTGYAETDDPYHGSSGYE